MAYPKNPLGYPDHYFNLLSAARNNTWTDCISNNIYKICRERQSRWAGFRSALRTASLDPSLTPTQRNAYVELLRLASGIKVSIARHNYDTDPNGAATLSYTFRSSANILATLMSATQTGLNIPTQDCGAADPSDPTNPTPSAPAYGTLSTPFDDVNPTIDEYEQHHLNDLKEFRLALVERIKRGILTYQISHPSLMGNPSIDFTPNHILATLSWMAENTSYHPSLDCAEALTDLITFNADNPELTA